MAIKSIDRESAKLAGLTADLMQKLRSGKITIQHLDWFNRLSLEEREALVNMKREREFPKILPMSVRIVMTYDHTLPSLMKAGNVTFANEHLASLRWPINVVGSMAPAVRFLYLLDSGGNDLSKFDLGLFSWQYSRRRVSFAGVRELLFWAVIHQCVPEGTLISGVRDEIRDPDAGTGFMSPYLRKVRDGFLLDCAGDGQFSNIPHFEKVFYHLIVACP